MALHGVHTGHGSFARRECACRYERMLGTVDRRRDDAFRAWFSLLGAVRPPLTSVDARTPRWESGNSVRRSGGKAMVSQTHS